ncbi:MAG: sulfotransferase [Opitutae bacterium]|nr:sulfotransferase [Opitutae bacterium]
MKKYFNTAVYFWRRNSWMFYVPGWFRALAGDRIDRPVFLLGNQGDGITLISRFLRRHQQVVSVSGNSDYWTGADEMQRAMEYRLPRLLRLSGSFLGTDPKHSSLTMPRSWSYGCDELWEAYHSTEDDANEVDRVGLKRAIGECIHRYSRSISTRFVDKSQVYTLKSRYIQSLLSESDPYFVLITRDPYASCYRAAMGKAGDMARYSSFLSFEERFELCIQHWKNCMSTILEDSSNLSHFKHWRYEDFLSEPEKNTRELCDFIGLDYQESMLPAPEHTIPFGTRYGDRWYPLRPDNNQAYFDKMTMAQFRQVEAGCGEIAKQFGYTIPSSAGNHEKTSS